MHNNSLETVCCLQLEWVIILGQVQKISQPLKLCWNHINRRRSQSSTYGLGQSAYLCYSGTRFHGWRDENHVYFFMRSPQVVLKGQLYNAGDWSVLVQYRHHRGSNHINKQWRSDSCGVGSTFFLSFRGETGRGEAKGGFKNHRIIVSLEWKRQKPLKP